MLVVLEGLDACGKATQSKLLADRLNAEGRTAILYSFPRYDTPLGQVIKRHLLGRIALRAEHMRDSSDINVDCDTYFAVDDADPIMFQCLAIADKYDAAHEIAAQLNEGYIVVCDRWTPSALAFGAADGLDTKWLASVQSRLPAPELNLLLTIPEEEALKRRPVLRDRYEKDRAKQAAVRKEYARIWADSDTMGVWLTIDGMGTVEEVHARIWRGVQLMLGEVI